MKRFSLFLLLIIIIICASGCSIKTEIEDRDFCMALGIELEEEKYKVSYVFPNLDELTGQSTEDDLRVYEISTDTIYGAEEKYGYQSNKRLDFSHLKVIIITKELASDNIKMKEFLSYVEINNNYSRNTLVFITEEKMSDIMDLESKVKGSIGNYLSDLFANNQKGTNRENSTLGDWVININNQGEVIGVPMVSIEKELPVITGEAIIKDGIYVTSTDNEEYSYLLMARGNGEGCSIDIDGKMTIKLKDIKRKFNFEIIDEKPIISITIKGIAAIVYGKSDRQEIFTELNELANSVLSIKIQEVLQRVWEVDYTDYLNSYKLTALSNRNLWLMYEDRQNEFYRDLTVKVMVDLDLD